MTYQPIPVKIAGVNGERTDVRVLDERALTALEELVVQLKINNKYFSLMMGEEITIRDIKEDM